MKTTGDIVVIGLGHLERADDGVGPALAEALAARDLPGIEVLSGPRDAAWILDCWRGRRAALVLDCVRSGRPTGTIHVIDPSEGPFVDSAAGSTHGLGLASAVELGRVLGDLPPRLVLLGVEGASFDLGGTMSPEAREALPRAVRVAVEIVTDWRVEHAAGAIDA